MISSRDKRRIFLLLGRPDQTRNPGLQDISIMVKQDQQSRPMCQQIPIGVARISFSRHTRCARRRVGIDPGCPGGAGHRPASKAARCADILMGATHISFSGQHRMRHPTSKIRPRVSKRGPRSLLSSDQHSKEHWPGGLK